MFYRLIHGDCFNHFTNIDEKFELILTDPPYNLISSSWDTVIDWGTLAKELHRKLKKTGTLIIFGKMVHEIDTGFKRRQQGKEVF